MQTARELPKGRIYANGELNKYQWSDLSKLAKAPRKSLMVTVLWSKDTIVRSRAESLIRSGVAQYIDGGSAIAPTERGLAMVSAHGLDGQ